MITTDPQTATTANGSTQTVCINVDNFTNIISMQFSVNFDTTIFAFEGVSGFNTNLPGFGPASVGTPNTGTDNGVITVSWLDFGLQPRTLQGGDVLFCIDLEVIGPDCSSGTVAVTNTPNIIEFFAEGDMPFEFVPVMAVIDQAVTSVTVDGDCGNVCGIGNVETGNDATINCMTNTIGANNDEVEVLISYTGLDAAVTITNNGAGTVGGDNPATVANGTIEITNLQEGDSWNITIAGGNCNFTSVGTVAAMHCDPLPCGVTSLETGFNQADVSCLSNTVGPNNDGVTISLDYSGIDPNASIVNNGSGVIGGDNPASQADGTIVITGLSEGDNWNFEITGGICNLQSTGTIPTTHCDPVTCGITVVETGTETNIICLSETAGNNNDGVLVEINYFGMDAAVSIVNNGSGTVQGDDPAVQTNGTITIADIMEGESWDISIIGGNCNLQSSGTVPSDNCMPPPCTISDVETGNEVNFVCSSNTSGNDPVTIEIGYIGFDPNVQLINNGGGNFAANSDDPAIDANGTIIITGLNEGGSWDISVEGGSCNFQSTGTIPTDICLPAPCGITSLEGSANATIICQSNTMGPNNDDVVVEIDYTGIDANAVVSNNGAGNIGPNSDDPATTPNGTIQLTGLGEGDSWDITISGGQCNLQSTGTIDGTECDVLGCGITNLQSGNQATFNCNSNTTGANNDGVTVQIAYSGMDPNVGIVNNGAGTISGNNPASESNGVILINNLQEGDSWDISLTGGPCNLQSTGTIPSMECDPVLCGITDIETGADVEIQCESNTPGNGNDNVVLFIDYTGVDPNAVLNIMSQGTNIGDDPAVTANGTLEIIGLEEGDNWNLSITGGACSGLTSSGNIPGNFCNPAPCGITDIETGNEVSFTCQANTSGPDEVLIEIVYTGMDAGATIVNNGGGTIGGDDPATETNGIITISGLNEGQTWNISITGGPCNLTSTGTIPSNLCQSTSCGITDVESGSEVTINCVEKTNGTNDEVTIEIEYSGVDGGVNVVNNGGGTIAGDDPSVVPDGTIIINGLNEGDSWNISVTGGNCNFTSSGTVSNTQCTPVTNSDSLVLIIESMEVDPGESFCLDVTTENFDQILSMQFTMEWNENILQFDSVGGLNLPALSQASFGQGDVNNGLLYLSWASVDLGLPSVTVPDGTVLFRLCFTATGGAGSGTLVDIVDGDTPIEVITESLNQIGLIDIPGDINLKGNNTTDLFIDIGDNQGTPGSTVCVDFTAQNFNNVVSMQYSMNWNSNILEYVEATNFGIASLAGSFNLTSPGNLSIVWFDPLVSGITVPDGTVLYSLCFEIVGNNGQMSDVDISGTPTLIEVKDGNLQDIPLSSGSGKVTVTSGPPSGLYVYMDCPTAPAGGQVCVPVFADKFEDLAAAQFTMEWDLSVLDYENTQNYNSTMLVNPANFGTPDLQFVPDNALTFAWTDITAQGVTIPDGSILFEVCFNVVATDCDSTDISFTDNPTVIEFTSGNSTPVVGTVEGCEFKTSDCQGLALSAEVTNVLCNGDATGAIDITVLSGTEPYTFNWSSLEGTEDINNKAAGNYTVTLTDGSGNSVIETFTIDQPAALDVDINSNDVSCNGDNNGNIDLNVSGGTPPYSYDWDDDSLDGDDSPNGLSAGTYSVTITDGNGCSTTASATIDEPSAIEIVETISNATNGTGGAVDISVSGGTPAYTYEWNDPDDSTTEDIDNLTPGLYTVTVTDANGCTNLETYTVVDFADCTIELSYLSFNASCAEATNGSINLTVTGANMPVTYAWNNGVGSIQDPNNLAPDTYCVTVTDAVGCVADTCIVVNANAGINVFATANDASCDVASDGSVNLTVSAGIAPFTYDWDDDTLDGVNNPSGLAAATYCVTVTDANGCSNTACAIVGEGTGIAASLNATDVSCNGDDDGTISVQVSNGSGDYDYSWMPSDLSGSSVSSLAPGNYNVTVTDNVSGCTTDALAVIDEPDPVLASITATDVSCNGDDDGTLLVSVQGGETPFDYDWTPTLANSPNPANLGPGDYEVTVTDNNGCTATASGNIEEPAAIDIVVDDISFPPCNGQPAGAVEISVSGGTPPYQNYQWNNVGVSPPIPIGSGQDISGLLAGTYNVVVTDDEGCTETLDNPIGITQPDLITLDVFKSDPNPGVNDGQIVVNVTGGTPDYNYIWAPALPNQNNQSDLGSGIYSVTVTDNNGCSKVTTVELIAPFIFSPAVVEDVACFGDSTGSIDITPLGGLPPYSYQWSTNDTIQDLNNLGPGSYSVTVTDQKGSILIQTYTVDAPAAPIEIVNADIECDNGSGNGAINISVNGGQIPYSYQWSNGPMSEDITGLDQGSYKVTITDANDCIFVSDEIEVCFEPDKPTVKSISVTNVECAGESNGSIEVEIESLGQPIEYIWVVQPPCATGTASDTITVQNPTGLEACTYKLIATDAFGQSITAAATISEPNPLIITVDNVIDENCNGGGNNGAINISVSGGTPPVVEYAWNVGGIGDVEDPNGLAGGTYSVTVTDSKGCFGVATGIEVGGLPPCLDSDADITEVDCAGVPTGSITVDVNGGVAPLNFMWEDEDGNPVGSGSNPTLANLIGGNYFVTVTDAEGNTQTGTYFVPFPDTLMATGVVTPSSNGSNGAIDVTVQGGFQPYSYMWSNTETTQDISGLAPGLYTITVTDARGCTAEATFEVVGPPIVAGQSTDITCNGFSNGSINLDVNGIPDFSFNWEGPNGFTSDLEDLDNLEPGLYVVTVSDGNGMTNVLDFLIETTSFIEASATVQDDPSFPNSDDGQATVIASNGITPYIYEWCSGETSQNANDLPVGLCIVTVTDALGCMAFDTIELLAPSIPVSFLTESSTCPGECEGTAEIIHEGGHPPFIYQWNDPLNQVTRKAVELCPGTYNVTVTDVEGYEEIKQVEVPEAIGMTITFQTEPSAQQDGRIEAFVEGGTEPYIYDWSTDDSGPLIQNLDPGTYMLTVFDALGCSQSASIELEGNFDCGLARNVITPNQDGFNDNFIINCADVFSNTLLIFDRWGELVFEADNYNNNWQGRDMDGMDLPEGGYFYIFDYNDGSEVKQIKGSITLIRE